MDLGTAVGVASLGLQVCKGLLEYYSDWKGYEDDIRETYVGIHDLEKTFKLLRKGLQAVPQKAFATRAQECLATCQDGIQQLEKQLKKLHKKAPAGLRQRAQVGGLHLIYPFRKSTLERLKEVAQGLMQQLNLATQAILLDNSHSIQHKADRIQNTVDTTETLATQIEATTLITQTQVSATAASVQALLAAEKLREFLEILKWLDAPNPTINHTQARAKYKTGTGEWLFRSQEYQNWVSGSSPIFWLHGKAGCCKTTLCSTIIERVSSQVSGHPGAAFAYFYFSFSDTRKQDYTNVLLSIVTQLTRKHTVHPLLLAAYLQGPSQKPSSETLEPVLVALLEGATVSYLVVDALDECSEEQREQILEGFKRITQAVPETRLLITSRMEADIGDLMEHWCHGQFPINRAAVNGDIDMYLENALTTDRKLVKLPSATKKEIQDLFHNKSNGMFRWAALQLDNIRDLKILRPAYISRALYDMPQTLDETYARMLSSIDSLYFDEARTALEWLAFSMRPLSVAELAEACSIRIDDTQEPVLEEGGYDALVGLFGVLSSLIDIGDPLDDIPDFFCRDRPAGDHSTKKYDTACYSQMVRLSHFSVKEYLVSDRLRQCHPKLSRYALREREVQLSLGQSCCAYILYFTKQPDAKIWIDKANPPREVLEAPPKDGGWICKQCLSDHLCQTYTLLPYVCKYWPQHQVLAELDEQPIPASAHLQLKVLESDRVRISWTRLYDCYSVFDRRRDTTALYWAVYFDLRQTVSLLCNSKSSHNVDKVGGPYHTALQAAASRGHDKIAEILVACGADVNCNGGHYGTALQAAAVKGSARIVDMLIANGADVNCTGGYFSTALQAAASLGHKTIVDILIANGADVNCTNGFFSTALRAAARQGHRTIVDILMANGASVG